ncbi:MAG: hypothetical protein JHC26_05180 [Thermofilum sp.]|uniref:hypothetical protein n=1 Tax=Thermofilum sp. TaxID=1961369 RepID=UPI002589DE5D|nr:hypothetical protein [Thermofilum sp.]MCI4408463.1 hypothetical protein [Thermofilum sp.]
MVERTYKVEDKEVKVNMYILHENPPLFVIEINGEPEIIKKYISEDGRQILFGIRVDDLLDTIRQALTPSGMVRD